GSPHCHVDMSARGPSVTPKTPPGASRGLGSSHSISIGDGAVGPPRSGFVLRSCVRKADPACVQATLADGLADTRFSREKDALGSIESLWPGDNLVRDGDRV